MKKLITSLLLACLAVFAAGCTDQKIEQANKFVDSANKKMDESKALISKEGASFTKVMNDVGEDFEGAKKAHEAELKESLKNYDKIMELEKGAASDFGEAAKNNSNEKFKAYYDMSAKDMQKTSELMNQNKQLVQAVLDSSDEEAYVQKSEAINAKTESLTKEATDIRAKLKKLEEEVNALNKG
jgi:hypothetical protein